MNVTPFPGSAGSGIGPALRAARRQDLFGGLRWRDMATPEGWNPAPAAPSAETPTLVLARAVAGIVAIAVERAREAGELSVLRDQVMRVLDQPGEASSPDPREADATEPPPITDADPQTEVERLASLMQRQTER
ncbi:hypothetical protein [Falsiroseomonas ponticola]|jgi:hypothetical protein|uniref:hypothetical protein n=1 Tax=Falsiroseomonas ponticola TaxID=2786951 RepID=UPI001934A4EC|nr:hypothetical protein [Roseomonas ponticola]